MVKLVQMTDWNKSQGKFKIILSPVCNPPHSTPQQTKNYTQDEMHLGTF